MAAAVIELGDAPAAWARLGFAPDAAGEVVLGEARVRLTGRGGGILGIEADDVTTPHPDGLPLQPSTRGQAGGPKSGLAHPNGATLVDHVVGLTGSLARTVAALWGLVVVVPELEGLGPLVGAPKDAVQPGRRIATVSRDAGLGTALALMTPRRT